MYLKTKKNKKGFTLIEVIVVIAILAILGAILVPSVLGYRMKAEKSNIQTSAKTVMSSIDAYNSDKLSNSEQIGDSAGAVSYSDGVSKLVSEKIIDEDKIPACLDGSHEVKTVAALEEVADGDFSVDQVNGLSTTIEISDETSGK